MLDSYQGIGFSHAATTPIFDSGPGGAQPHLRHPRPRRYFCMSAGTLAGIQNGSPRSWRPRKWGHCFPFIHSNRLLPTIVCVLPSYSRYAVLKPPGCQGVRSWVNIPTAAEAKAPLPKRPEACLPPLRSSLLPWQVATEDDVAASEQLVTFLPFFVHRHYVGEWIYAANQPLRNQSCIIFERLSSHTTKWFTASSGGNTSSTHKTTT